MTRFNIIGFGNASTPWHPRKLCPIHHAVLIPKRNESTGEYETGMLRCPLCGSSYSEKEASNEEGVLVRHEKQHKTAIITGKKQNKKYYDKSGNLINDPDLIAEIQRGANVIEYHEQLPGPVKNIHYDKNTKRLIRSKRSG